MKDIPKNSMYVDTARNVVFKFHVLKKVFAGTQVEFFNIDLVSYNLDKCY